MTHNDTEPPEIRVRHRAAGWTVLALSVDPQDCTTNHLPDNAGQPPCTATAVWRVVQLCDMHATVGFWCDTHLPDKHRRPITLPGAA